jgi:hypothetical protein
MGDPATRDIPLSSVLEAREEAITEHAPHGEYEGAGKRQLGIGFWIAVGWVVVIVLAAVLAPWLPIKDPAANYIEPSQGAPPYSPSSTFWFGSDQDARDMFSRTIWGARTSLTLPAPGFTTTGQPLLRRRLLEPLATTTAEPGIMGIFTATSGAGHHRRSTAARATRVLITQRLAAHRADHSHPVLA